MYTALLQVFAILLFSQSCSETRRFRGICTASRTSLYVCRLRRGTVYNFAIQNHLAGADALVAVTERLREAGAGVHASELSAVEFNGYVPCNMIRVRLHFDEFVIFDSY